MKFWQARVEEVHPRLAMVEAPEQGCPDGV